MKLFWTAVGRSCGHFGMLALKAALALVIGLCLSALAIKFFLPSGRSGLGSAVTANRLDSQSLWLCIGLALLARALMSRTLRLALLSLVRGSRDESRSKSDLKKLTSNPKFIGNAGKTFVTRYPSEDVVGNLLGALMNPSVYFDRVKEHVVIQTSRYTLATSITIRVPAGASLILPVIAQPKRDLLDDLDVELDGAPANTLSYMENQGAVLMAIDSLYEVVSGASPQLMKDVDLSDLQQIVASPDPIDARDQLDQLAAVVTNSPAETKVEAVALSRIIEFCATNYFILVALPSRLEGTTRKLKVSSRFQRGTSDTWAVDLIRVALGLRHRSHVFTLARAIEAVSYHFSLLTPKGMYAYMVDFDDVRVRETPTLPAERKRMGVPEKRFNQSTKFVHAYLRDYVATSRASTPAITVELRERPPALLEVALLLSVFLTATTWVVGAYHDEVFRGTGLTGSWPTVLFGVPTLLIGWLVTRIDAEVMARMSFTSVAMVAWLSCNAAASVVAAALKSSGISTTKAPYVSYGFEFDHIGWTLLMGSCALCTIILLILSACRAARYAIAENNLTNRALRG